ncbi:MAG: hypothetical protein IT269_11885, partial [Saprospiraceae bacterium]|nr:hypothetical protein [Saprospiraceae bacterium]
MLIIGPRRSNGDRPGWLERPRQGVGNTCKSGIVEVAEFGESVREFQSHGIQRAVTVLGYDKLGNAFQALPVFIFQNLVILRAKCRRLKQQHDIQMIIIDYLQLMTGSTEGNRNGNREQEIG